MMEQQPEITLLLNSMRGGDPAAADRAALLIYDELKRLARSYMKREKAGHTLQPTALVNEAFLRLMGSTFSVPDRNHFMGMAAQIMRRVLVDHHRQRMAAKRGDGAVRVTLSGLQPESQDCEITRLHDALLDLEKANPQLAKIVELRFFGGFEEREVADILGVSYASVRRDWTFARAWLITRLS